MNLVSRGLGNGNIVVRGLGGSVGTQEYQKIWAEHLDARPLLHPPTIELAPFGVGVPLIDASATIHEATLTTTVTVAFPLLDASATIHDVTVAPTFTTGVPLLSTPPVLYDPTLTTSATIALPLLDATATVFAPRFFTETSFIYTPLLADIATLFPPAINTGVLLDIIEMMLGIAQSTDWDLGIVQSLAAASGVIPVASYVLGVETQPDDLAETVTVAEFTVGIGSLVDKQVGVRQDFDARVGIDESFSRNLTQTLDY